MSELTCVVTVFVGQVVTQRTVRHLAVQVVLVHATIPGHLGLLLSSPLPEVGSEESRKCYQVLLTVTGAGAPFSPTVVCRLPILRPEGEG